MPVFKPERVPLILHTWPLECYSEVDVTQEQVVWLAPKMAAQAPFFDNPVAESEKCVSASFNATVIIKGVTLDGRMFRPSDWCQRLAAAATLNCSYCLDVRGRAVNPYVKVIIEDGVYSLWISQALREIDPPLYDFMVLFGRDNGLQLSMV